MQVSRWPRRKTVRSVGGCHGRSTKRGWTFNQEGGLEKDILEQRKAPGMVELGCRMLGEGKGERDEIEGVCQWIAEAFMCKKEFAGFHELYAHPTAFNAIMQEIAAYSNSWLLGSNVLLFQRNQANKLVWEWRCCYTVQCISVGLPLAPVGLHLG